MSRPKLVTAEHHMRQSLSNLGHPSARNWRPTSEKLLNLAQVLSCHRHSWAPRVVHFSFSWPMWHLHPCPSTNKQRMPALIWAFILKCLYIKQLSRTQMEIGLKEIRHCKCNHLGYLNLRINSLPLNTNIHLQYTVINFWDMATKTLQGLPWHGVHFKWLPWHASKMLYISSCH